MNWHVFVLLVYNFLGFPAIHLQAALGRSRLVKVYKFKGPVASSSLICNLNYVKLCSILFWFLKKYSYSVQILKFFLVFIGLICTLPFKSKQSDRTQRLNDFVISCILYFWHQLQLFP